MGWSQTEILAATGGKIMRQDVINFCFDLEQMIRSGIPIIDGLRDMRERKWDVRHGGYNVVYVRENANYTVPLDVLRELEDAGVLGSLHPDYYVTANAGTFAQNECIGREMGRELKLAGVEGVLLVST